MLSESFFFHKRGERFGYRYETRELVQVLNSFQDKNTAHDVFRV